MVRLPVILLILILLCLIMWYIVTSFKKGRSGLKIMLLGINLTLFGGIIVLDQNSNLGGAEYLLVLFGLTTSILGFGKDD